MNDLVWAFASAGIGVMIGFLRADYNSLFRLMSGTSRPLKDCTIMCKRLLIRSVKLATVIVSRSVQHFYPSWTQENFQPPRLSRAGHPPHPVSQPKFFADETLDLDCFGLK